MTPRYTSIICEDGKGNIVSVDEIPAPPPTRKAAVDALIGLIVTDQITAYADDIDNELAHILSPLLPEWEVGETVAAGDLRSHDGDIWEAVQGHVTQAAWTPPAAPALWRMWRDPDADTPAAWVQPTGSHDAYDIGERVTYEGTVWVSTVEINVWQPGVHGWSLET